MRVYVLELNLRLKLYLCIYISRSAVSLFATLSFRNYGVLGGENLETEQIYVHSKLMIVDDRVAVIGSANINDRRFYLASVSSVPMPSSLTFVQPPGRPRQRDCHPRPR